MPTATARYVEFDVSLTPMGFERERTVRTYGFKEQRLEPREPKPLVFRGKIGDLQDKGKLFGELLTIEPGQSYASLDQMGALLNAYLASRKGLYNPTPEQKEWFGKYFETMGQGNTCHTVVDFDNGDKSMKKRHDSDRRVLLINKPELLAVENGRIKEVKNGERKPTLWPAPGYVGRTCDGAYDSDGIPIETWLTRKEAQQTWLDADPDKDEIFAEDAVSHTWAREEGQGKAVVGRRFFDRDGGRFYLGAYGDPRNGDDRIGRSPASR